ncbi:MAG: hypothetical protein ACTSO6_01580 [Promethearchaeota archaeon]
MSLPSAPNVIKILQEQGEINDELDFALMNYLITNRGTGFTACQPQLVELENGKQAIKMNLDNTFIDKDNNLKGLGIVGTLFVDVESPNLNIIYCSSSEELTKNIEKLKNAGIQPQDRPKGKY